MLKVTSGGGDVVAALRLRTAPSCTWTEDVTEEPTPLEKGNVANARQAGDERRRWETLRPPGQQGL